MSMARVWVLSLFFGAGLILIRLSIEKPRSQSAVDTGKARATEESIENNVWSEDRESDI